LTRAIKCLELDNVKGLPNTAPI